MQMTNGGYWEAQGNYRYPHRHLILFIYLSIDVANVIFHTYLKLSRAEALHTLNLDFAPQF